MLDPRHEPHQCLYKVQFKWIGNADRQEVSRSQIRGESVEKSIQARGTLNLKARTDVTRSPK